MGKNENFIAQTAKDYDIDFDIVAKMYIKYPETFYLELEEYIKARARRNNPGDEKWTQEDLKQE